MVSLHLDGVSKSYGDRTIFTGLTLHAKQGDMVALTGPSGCGKSTVLNCVGLLERFSSGRVYVDGLDISRLGAGGRRRFRRRSLGYLFQNYALIDNASVGHNVAIARRLDKDGGTTIADALKAVGMGGREREPVFQLSGGEQQRVALARLLVKSPEVVLADEPTGALDDENEAMVISRLERFASDGAVVLIATHSAGVAARCSDHFDLGGSAKG